MFRMYASNSHSYTHLILALGIVREPTVWVFITSKYPVIHDIGLPTLRMQLQPVFHCSSLNALDPGSGRQIPAIWHGTGVWHGHFTPES